VLRHLNPAFIHNYFCNIQITWCPLISVLLTCLMSYINRLSWDDINKLDVSTTALTSNSGLYIAFGVVNFQLLENSHFEPLFWSAREISYNNFDWKNILVTFWNKTNLVYNLFLVYLSISTCFGRPCAHHQEKQLCLCNTWYLLFCVDDQVLHKHSCFSWL